MMPLVKFITYNDRQVKDVDRLPFDQVRGIGTALHPGVFQLRGIKFLENGSGQQIVQVAHSHGEPFLKAHLNDLFQIGHFIEG